jgi:hypothetical protein
MMAVGQLRLGTCLGGAGGGGGLGHSKLINVKYYKRDVFLLPSKTQQSTTEQ